MSVSDTDLEALLAGEPNSLASDPDFNPELEASHGAPAVNEDPEVPETQDERIARLQKERDEMARDRETIAPILDAIKEDPSKIHDVRAALLGKPQAPVQERVVYQQPAPSINPADQAEYLRQLNEQILLNPAESVFKIANMIADQKIAATARPLADTQAQQTINNFIAGKRGADPYYDKGIGKIFEERIRAIPRERFGMASYAELTAGLETEYDAASGRFYREAQLRAAKASTGGRSSAPNIGGSGAGGAGSVVIGATGDTALTKEQRMTLTLAKAAGMNINDPKVRASLLEEDES